MYADILITTKVINLKKKPKVNPALGTAIIVNEYGSIDKVIFKIITNVGKEIEIEFPDNSKLVLPKMFIRAKRVLIYKTLDGVLHPYDPDLWRSIELEKKFGIKQLRFNLQNFSLQESKSAIHRWTLPDDIIKKLSPLFKLLMICIVIGVIGWAAFNFGGKMLTDLMASRSMDCHALITNETLGYIASNITQPIGV